MGLITKQSSLGLMANYIGVVLGFVNVLLLMPFILQPDQIGLLNIILSMAFLLFPLMDFSASAMLNRYFANVDTPQQMLHFSAVVFLVGTAVFAILVAVGAPLYIAYFQENSPEVIPYRWMVFGVAIVIGCLSLLENFAFIQHKTHIVVLLKEVLFRVFIMGLLTVFFFLKFPFEQYLFLHYSMYLLVAIALLGYLRWKGYLHFKTAWPAFDKKQYKRMGNYGMFVFLTGLASVIALKIDTIMLGSLKGLTEVGIYSIAMYMTVLMDVPKRMIVQSSFPIIRRSAKEGDWENVRMIQEKAILNLTAICGILLLFMLVNVQDIYRIIPKGGLYNEGVWVVLFLGLAKLVDIISGINYEVFLASRHYRYNMLFFFVLAISAVTLNYLFIPGFGVKGAAFATFLSYLIYSLVKIFLFRSIFRLDVYSRNLIFLLIALGVMGGLVYLIPLPFHPIAAIALRSSVAGLGIYLFLRISGLTPDLNQLFNGIIDKLPALSFLKM
jgi:O-antigen/teichoic acid export membrane protein